MKKLNKKSMFLLLALFMFILSACGDQGEVGTETSSTSTSSEESLDQGSSTEEGEDQVASSSEMPTGIVPIEDWEGIYPDYVASFQSNADMSSTTYGGSEPYSYLEKNPYLNTLYEGYGFAIQYDRARGHVYALEDVINTERPKAGASCLACKTSEYEEVLAEDRSVASQDFYEYIEEYDVHIGMTCFDCHGENPPQIQPNRNHLADAIEKNPQISEVISEKAMTCAQCHVEYYQESETKMVTLPWDHGFGADEAYQYYQENEFADWEHPQTGARLLKAQHPETETFYGGPHQELGYDCLSCHMPQVEGESGNTITSHHWTSPLKDVDNTCLSCHTDWSADEAISQAEAIQKPVVDETDRVGYALEEYVNNLATAVEDGGLSDEDLERAQEIHREAQFYFDYVFVENSEGFHNQEKSLNYLEHAMTLIEEGNAILQGQ